MAHRKNRKRNQPKNAPIPPREESGPETARRILRNVPLPTNVTFAPNIHLSAAAAETAPPPPASDGENGPVAPPRESRANATKSALRSRLLFPLELLEKINLLSDGYSNQLELSTCLEQWLGVELARSSVQCDECFDKLQINKLRVIERAGTSFDDDCADRADRIAEKLSEHPSRNQRTLARSKHGALILIDRWTLLGDAIDSERGIDEALRQTAYDLLGIDHVFRHGTSRVPAATDVVGLRSLVAREVEKHRLYLEQSLNAQSESEREMAQLGLPRFRDSTTNSLRGDLNRARQRFTWAFETIRALKSGVDASTLIDPYTKKPVAVGPPLAAVSKRGRPTQPEVRAEAQASPQPTAAPVSPPSPPIPSLPADCSEERKEMWWVAAGTVLSQAAMPGCDAAGPAPGAA